MQEGNIHTFPVFLREKYKCKKEKLQVPVLAHLKLCVCCVGKN